jgi:hypothetical protein
MATDYALSETHDKTIQNGDYVLVSGAVEVAQSCNIRLLVFLREWTYDPTIGLPWEEELFKSDVSERRKKQIVLRNVLKTPGVKRLFEFQFGVDPINKGALVEFRGETNYSGEPITVRVTI